MTLQPVDDRQSYATKKQEPTIVNTFQDMSNDTIEYRKKSRIQIPLGSLHLLKKPQIPFMYRASDHNARPAAI